VGVQDDFFALGGHSLMAIRLFSLIETEFGRKLPVTLLFESPTIAHLAQALRSGEPDQWSTLVPIQTKGARPPLFLVHGFGGGVLGYAELARGLGDDQPVYGLQAVGVDGRGTPHETVEEMAAHFVEVIRAQQSQGPYYLGGYCFGGIVAYEVARQLEAQQQPVALVAIFEGYAPARLLATEATWSPRLILAYLRNLPYWFQDYMQLGAGQRWQTARRSALRLWRLAARRLGISVPVRLEDLVPVQGSEPDSLRRIMALHIRASDAYLPGPYNGGVVMFNIRSQSLTRTPDPQRGWGRLVRGGLEVRQIAGSHHNILQPPHVQTLARALKESLDQG
jgi:thioesterase domain-containing protein